MTIRVLFFGATSEAAKERATDIVCESETSASAVILKLTNLYPKLKNQKLLFAVNQEYVGTDQIIHDGDELAIFTAVSGG